MNRKNIFERFGLIGFILVFGVFCANVQATTIPSVKMDTILIKTEPTPLQTGEYADVWVKLLNKGNTVSKDTSLELIPEFPFSADPDEDLKRDFGKVYAGEEYHAHFQIRVDENAVQGENKLKFKYTANGRAITEKVSVQVRTNETALVIKKVDLKSETIAPSKTEKLIITLKNLADCYFKNIDVSLGLSSSDIPLITVGSSTRKRIQKIAPNKTASVSFDIKASSSADQKAYKVPINLDYENEAGTSFSKEEYTGIVVGGKPKLETNLAEIEDGYFQPGTTKEISISLVNRGLSVAKFVSLELMESSSYQVVSPSKIYIGNMESDDYESSSFKIYVNGGVKKVNIPIKLNYKDSEGNSITDQQSISFKTYTSGEVSRMHLGENNGTLYIVVAIIIIIVGGYFGYKRWKSKKS